MSFCRRPTDQAAQVLRTVGGRDSLGLALSGGLEALLDGVPLNSLEAAEAFVSMPQKWWGICQGSGGEEITHR